MTFTITVLYIIIPLIILFGIMFLIRRKREQNLPEKSNKVSSIKAEETEKPN